MSWATREVKQSIIVFSHIPQNTFILGVEINITYYMYIFTTDTVLINDCPPAGSRTELELSVSVDGSCNPGYLNISVEAAVSLINVHTYMCGHFI